jgi:hypothetical protein
VDDSTVFFLCEEDYPGFLNVTAFHLGELLWHSSVRLPSQECDNRPLGVMHIFNGVLVYDRACGTSSQTFGLQALTGQTAWTAVTDYDKLGKEESNGYALSLEGKLMSYNFCISVLSGTSSRALLPDFSALSGRVALLDGSGALFFLLFNMDGSDAQVWAYAYDAVSGLNLLPSPLFLGIAPAEPGYSYPSSRLAMSSNGTIFFGSSLGISAITSSTPPAPPSPLPPPAPEPSQPGPLAPASWAALGAVAGTLLTLGAVYTAPMLRQRCSAQGSSAAGSPPFAASDGEYSLQA